eukprot:TRINITY_DN2031_c0_g1_i1.p1 TRINITY_DN2031_c0_g1~~TRINITY_DN2031_c0_g1_i1.p1  ORF type:complete len:662 (+),score=223.62 TRINITY_DN2031_c0_g1_i1:54-2039(+)
MEEARQWLQHMDVPLLVEGGLRALVENKPEDPAEFLSTYFAQLVQKRDAVATRAMSSGRLKQKKKMQICTDMPSPDKLNDSSLAALLRSSAASVAVIDVRADRAGGWIPGSHHVPADEVGSAELADRFGGMTAIVFVSVLSPDLDQTAAIPVMQSLQEKGLSTSVFILLGGLRGWMHEYSDDSALVEGYDARCWGHAEAGQSQPGKATTPRKKRAGPRVVVPEAAEKMSASTLAVLVAQQSAGTVVVDVRGDTKGGSIPGSVHIPCDDFVSNVARYVDEWADKATVVFVSLQSPDLDQTAAQPFMQAIGERSSKTEVYLLIGGMRGWVSDYGGDAKLVSDYDAAVWSPSGGGGGGGGGGAAAATKGRKKKGMQISVPDAPSVIPPQELATLLRAEVTSPKKDAEKPLVVVDVRAEQRGGRIASSVHVPCQDVLADVDKHADLWAGKDAVVFVSSKSPDLDQTAAIPLMQKLHERGSSAEVFILLDGMRGWMRDYSQDDSLVVDFEERAWELDSPRTEVPKKKKGKGGMKIGVPEAPERMSEAELALLLKAGATDAVAVVDVRADQRGGRITGSQHVPCDEVLARAEELAKQWAEKSTVVFVSVQSPDLDETAATEAMQRMHDIGSSAVCFTLTGGLRGWMNAHSGNSALVQDYDEALWKAH